MVSKSVFVWFFQMLHQNLVLLLLKGDFSFPLLPKSLLRGGDVIIRIFSVYFFIILGSLPYSIKCHIHIHGPVPLLHSSHWWCRLYSYFFYSSDGEIITVRSVYLRLLMRSPPSTTPGIPWVSGMMYLTVQRNMSGDTTHPCRTDLLKKKGVSLLFTAVCCQFRFLFQKRCKNTVKIGMRL